LKLVDLSNWIEQDMPVYPSDEKPDLIQDKFLDIDKYNNFTIKTGTHVGTHIDSPMHLTNSTKFIGEYSLENFCGRACVIDARGLDIIKYVPLYDELIKNKDIVLLYTGFDTEYGSDDYYNAQPVIDISFAELLVKAGIKIIGMDTPSPDRYPFLIHKFLLSNNIFILENLRNLQSLLNEKDFEVFAFPLKIKADASLVRAVASIK